ncbi:transposase [Thermodesulfobacteriota bacterium]
MNRNIPDPFGIDEIRFSNCFSAPGFRIFVALIIGWVLTVGKHTVSQVILTVKLHEYRHFATIYRFLQKGEWCTDMVAYCLFRILVETLIAEGIDILVVLDDTLNKHRGPHICGAGWQHDGSASQVTKQKGYGVCFVIIGLAIRLPDISDRVFCLPYAARLWWPPKAKVKPQTLPYKKKPELGLDLINMTHSWLEQGEIIRVVTDLGYCCETILKKRSKGVHVTGRLRKDAALYWVLKPPVVRRRGRPRKKGHRLPTPATMFDDPNLRWSEIKAFCYGKEIRLMVHGFTALWYHSAGQEPLSVVLCRDPSGRHADTVFFDTDLTASVIQIIERYAARWSIEVTNRETKQLLGAADPQCRREQSVVRTPMFAYWAYSFVVLWFVRQFSTAKNLVADPAPWYRQKKTFTFSDMLAAARRSHFRLRISSDACNINNLEIINQPRYTRGLKHTEFAKL